MKGARISASAGPRSPRGVGVALILVLVVLGTLLLVGAPFVVSMMLHDRASQNFAGEVAARLGAEAARDHAVAALRRTSWPSEWAREAEELEAERPDISRGTGRAGSGGLTSVRPRSSSSQRRRGMVIRRDLGERPEDRRSRGRSRRTEAGRETRLPEFLRESLRGPSPKDWDAPDDIRTELPASIRLPEAAPADPGVVTGDGRTIETRSGRGLATSVEVEDEQGKINVNTAPPHLIAGVFGVSQLARSIDRTDIQLVLDDASQFRGDMDDATIDGAVVIVHPKNPEAVEAVTYRRRTPLTLEDCFRGAFLSGQPVDSFPAGSFVYDLRGWKVAYHRLWSRRHGGFHPRSLRRFSSIEALREVADWQIASLFVSRFRGEGLTPDLLRESGVSVHQLEKYGIDRVIFTGDDRVLSEADSARYKEAVRVLRRLRVSSRLIRQVEGTRGPWVVMDLAARLEGASRQEVRQAVDDLETALRSDRRKKTRLDRKYLVRALAHLGKTYATPGIETILPEDLERFRQDFTVISHVPARWGEAQSIVTDVSSAGPTYEGRVPRASDFNPGTLVRIERKGAGGEGEFNVVAAAGGAGAGGVRFAYPLRSSYRAYEATVKALQRHPVNANSASRRVLRAVFAGVQGPDTRSVVTPFEADRVAAAVIGSRPLRSHGDFLRILEGMAGDRDGLDRADIDALYVNAVQPTNYHLRGSTTGLCYATGDVYTVEARGALRSLSGAEIARSGFREVVDVSPPGPLTTGLLTQRDFADGIFLRAARLGVGFPETHHQFLLQFPGTRAHLVQSRPLLLHREARIEPMGDLGSLRLFPGETYDKATTFTFPEDPIVYHFRDTYDGLELAHGEPFVLPVQFAGAGAGGGARAGGRGGGGQLDLTMVPGGVEFWMRLRTFPSARSDDGLLKLVEGGGGEPDRNTLQLLYDPTRSRVVLRIRDGSMPDPSVVVSRENGQYLQVEASRPLDLHTWYHLRIAWDGVFGGGAQLFIDGIPVGKDNLSTTLASGIPATGPVASISVEDASRFPREGVVKIGAELFEYERTGSSSLRIRQEPPSRWRPPVDSGYSRSDVQRILRGGRIPAGLGVGGAGAASTGALGASPTPSPTPSPGPAAGAAATGSGLVGAASAEARIMRAPYNRRGSVPSAHSPGDQVSVWGYSLAIRRKIRDPQGREYQVPDGDSRTMVWGPGGLSLTEPLPANSFPADLLPGIRHYIDFRPLEEQLAAEGGAGGLPGGGTIPIPPGGWPGGSERPDGREDGLSTGEDQIIVPMFAKVVAAPPPGCGPERAAGALAIQWLLYSASHPTSGRRAIDYFQSRGVCRVGGDYVLYQKVELPPEYIQAQEADRCRVEAGNHQTTGLRILGRYSPGGAAGAAAAARRRDGAGGVPAIELDRGDEVEQLSLMASGAVQGRYPPTGVLEIEGVPPPWEVAAGRPDLRGQSLFANHPDDTVEWLRYVSLHENLFVGRLSSRSNFRGYPSRDRLLKKQLDHDAGAAIRLVMELSEGGAGFGDYVTIATSDPSVYEPEVHRVYRVFEHDDGRFFVSLVDVDRGGQEIRNSPGLYRHAYFRSMNPRLVKFPSWGLPEVGGGSLVLFGSAVDLSGGGGGLSGMRAGGDQYREENSEGVTVDEVRRLWNRSIRYHPILGPQVRHVLVPLESGRVREEPNAGLSGRISAEQRISLSGPLEVLVVSVSSERGAPSLFAQGAKEGVLRIGNELFYFEDPMAGTSVASGGGARGQGSARLDSRSRRDGQTQPADPAVPVAVMGVNRERALAARYSEYPRIGVSNARGHFERSGFARIRDGYVERAEFFEIFYYESFSGGAFTQCRRGQFHTPILSVTNVNGTVHNVSKRLRLVGRSLLGTRPESHGYGDPVELLPYVTLSPITGPMTSSGIPVKNAQFFSPAGGYVLVDPASPTASWEIIAHLGAGGGGYLRRPRDERGRGCLRGSFGTRRGPVGRGLFAYELPFRYYDRYESGVDSESLAYLQKSLRAEGALWRSIQWWQRPWVGRERQCDIVVLARLDGAPDWDTEPTNRRGGLFFFERKTTARSRRVDEPFPIGLRGDELELRIYFRYRSGAYQRLQEDLFRDDWKETPVLDSLTVEYEKDGAVVRHEELPF